ncbi:MAG: HlyD family type I secretion periplasmic adaptor subunit [Rickettsiaceae bacterium]|nr:HlyD family type I secretion periplasmic adaptor subunit [Rickettsiaceae bacterium]
MTKKNDSSSDQTGQKPSPEQMQKMLAMLQQQQGAQSKFVGYRNALLIFLSKYIEIFVRNLDAFIKYVINKSEIDKTNVMSTARGPIIFGTYVIIFFMIFGGIWAATAPLDSASFAIGSVIPSSKRKYIQHPRGGYIKEIFVQLGDHVKEGDKILALDDVEFKAAYETYLNKYRTYLAAENRLSAERDKLDKISFDPFLVQDESNPQVSALLRTEEQLFASRKEAYQKQIESLEQRHLQYINKLESYLARRISIKKNKEITQETLRSHTELFKKKFISRQELLQMEARAAQASSELSATEADIAGLREQLAQDEAESLRFKSEYLSQIIDNLNKVQAAKNEAKEAYTQAKDALDKAILRSPVNGTVIDITQITTGGVIGPGNLVAEILPNDDRLVIEARIPNSNIDSVHVGLKAKIKFSAFKSRTTPAFKGVVTSLSPDVVSDKGAQMGRPEAPAYVARIELDMEDFDRIAKKRKLVLRPGMQAEIQIVTGTRTLLRYLLDPITDSMYNAFREK